MISRQNLYEKLVRGKTCTFLPYFGRAKYALIWIVFSHSSWYFIVASSLYLLKKIEHKLKATKLLGNVSILFHFPLIVPHIKIENFPVYHMSDQSDYVIVTLIIIDWLTDFYLLSNHSTFQQYPHSWIVLDSRKKN